MGQRIEAATGSGRGRPPAAADDRRGPAIVEDGIAMREAYLAAYLD